MNIDRGGKLEADRLWFTFFLAIIGGGLVHFLAQIKCREIADKLAGLFGVAL